MDHQDLATAQPGAKKARKPRTRARGNNTLHQMSGALTGSTLRDENKKQTASVQPANGVQKNKGGSTRLPRTKRKPDVKHLTDALENAAVVVEEKGAESTTNGEQRGAKRTTRAMNGTLPLAFDSTYLKKMGNTTAFMNNGEIMNWIGSVSHHLKGWYCECVCDPANEADLQAAQAAPLQFADVVFQHEFESRGFVKPSVESEEGALKKYMVPNFVQLTGIVSRRIERDGQRSGAFARGKGPHRIRQAAIWLLVTVIMDLTVNMGYFIRLFLGLHNAHLTADDERILLAMGDTSAATAQPLDHLRSGIDAAPRTLSVPADLFASVSETFEKLPKSTGCRILVHTPSGADLARFIVLVGSASEMDRAEDVITKAMETSAAP
jgi:hypothetical protein